MKPGIESTNGGFPNGFTPTVTWWAYYVALHRNAARINNHNSLP